MNMKKTGTIFISAVLVLFSLSGCYYDNFAELHPSAALNACDTTKTISYSQDIVPILNNSCGINNSCHSSSNTSNVDLSNYAGVDTSVVKGKFYSSVNWDGFASKMPKGSPTQISICNITQIKKWVAAGAPNN